MAVTQRTGLDDKSKIQIPRIPSVLSSFSLLFLIPVLVVMTNLAITLMVPPTMSRTGWYGQAFIDMRVLFTG
ncbi:uncharacterized protein ASPGLDRAFT_46968 [Aspergillus glaucus CBS 516.65]|uniref:Uncharacterized protein n=1 Tax=Aspergillus glaucus CBS 516.65 TaxID=1160497 RepID=A0A1L9VJS6_ASPGL|nr:hypothetical protein ASPGLDRAFT_46968 [Aspergillus glaucus CBS 516.65]OJJ84154.1 hypothetical protein ASPGLDRAFT_46968 [Aspergillus glaucus CBS 516.65]